MPSILDPIQIGRFKLKNRVWMAPLTRGRATRDHVPTELMSVYYRQRAEAGLIISEATGISLHGSGWPYSPGIWNVEQTAAWRQATAAVHDGGGRIFAQLWHMGRLAHPAYSNGIKPVSASATTAPGSAHTYTGRQPYVAARAMTMVEIRDLVVDYVHAARNAIEAGFDGVQIHAANGYLIDQFLRDNCNFRDDVYGGSINNRIRLLREIVEAVCSAIGSDRTAVRLSPNGETQGVDDSNQNSLFPAVAAMLSTFDLAFLELREPGPAGSFGSSHRPPVAPAIREVFDGILILNSDYTLMGAEAAIAKGAADAITFGRAFLANPDLPTRFARGIALNVDQMKTWYSQGPEGYTDYPAAGSL